MLPSTRGQHSYDCRCHTCYDWTKSPSISSNTGSSDRSTASHQAYEAEWDNWTQLHENNLPFGAPISPSSTIATHATWNSNDPLPDDGAANVVKVNAIKSRTDLCILDSGANRIVFNSESWLENTNSLPLTPTNTSIHGISGTLKASMQTIVGNSPILICPTMTDNVLSQGWLAKNKSIMTTYNSIDNVYCIAFGHTTFRIEMANDSLYYLSKDQVRQILAHVNNIDNNVKIDVTKVFSKEQLVRANEVRRLHYALLHPSDSTLIKSLKYGLIIGTRLTAQDVYLYRLVFGACPCCLAGKTRSPTYHESRSPSALMPGHIVHVDIIPFTAMCLGGIQYHLLCCDEFSTYLQSFPMKSKSNHDIILAFTLTIAFFQQYYSVQIIHSDHENTILSDQTFLNRIYN